LRFITEMANAKSLRKRGNIMEVKIINETTNPEKTIEKCGRVCYKSDDKMTEESTGNFISKLIKSGHDSVLEHASITFEISGVSRALTHQLVRHRIGVSPSQQSQRYVKESNFEYVFPKSIYENKTASLIYTQAMESIDAGYYDLIEQGIPKEDARMVLPNACCSRIAVTMNYRALRHFLKLRLDKHAQWEIRALANEMLELVMENAPNVFQDLKK